MGKKNKGINLHLQKDDLYVDQSYKSSLSDKIARHCSRSLEYAEVVHGVQCKVVKKKKFMHDSPSSKKNHVHGDDNNVDSRRESHFRSVCGESDVAVLPRMIQKDTVETKEKSDHDSPCSSSPLASCPSPETRGKGPSLPREKMGNFTFDDHVERIERGLSEDKKSSFVVMDSMFYFCYNNGRRRSFNFIKLKEIFKKNYVLIPIVGWNHWRLVIFCHFGESTCLKNKTRCILLLDSMDMGALDIEPDLRKFVFDIFRARGRPEIKDVIYQIPILVPKVPQQRNDVDCGRFVLYFMKKFMDDAPKSFSHLNGYPYFMTRGWFTSDNFEEFCDELKKHSPPHSPGTTSITVVTRRSQRILQRPPCKTRRTVSSQKSSKEKVEVLVID